MDTLSAFALGEANRDKERKVFDWDKAARILRERRPASASAGLSSDLEWTAGTIFANGAPVTDDYTFLASTWATPVLVIDDEEITCFVMVSTVAWDEKTKWPESALKILQGDAP